MIAVGPKGRELKDLLHQYTKGDGHGNVVMARMGDDALARMDQLVEATLFGSRSECAAFLIGAGIASQKELFDRLGAHTDGGWKTQRAASPGRAGCPEAQRTGMTRARFGPLCASGRPLPDGRSSG